MSKRRYRRLRRIRAAATLCPLLAFPLARAQVAHAYPEDPNGCEATGQDLHWAYASVNDPLWTAGAIDRRPWVTNAINKLGTALDSDASHLFTVAQISVGGVQVSIRDTDPNAYGSSNCDSLWVNSNYSTARFYQDTARHEMYHVGGAEHGGNIDSWGGDNPPTMATCILWTSQHAANGLWQDDAAYANWLRAKATNRQLDANLGFEQGISPWLATAGSVNYKTSGGYPGGPGYIAWNSPGISNYVYQTITLQTGDDNQPYRGVLAHRQRTSGYKTDVQAAVYTRQITHPYPANGCDYPDGVVNPNDYGLVSTAWVQRPRGAVVASSTGWGVTSTPWYSPGTAPGWEIQMRAYGVAVDSSGNKGLVDFDDVRAEGT